MRGGGRWCPPPSLRGDYAMVTPKKPLPPIPSDEDLARDFTGQGFRDLIAANAPGADVARFSDGALASARVYACNADLPRRLTTTARPLKAPRYEAALDFTIGLQVAYLQATDGKMPSMTANRTANLGPFARILQQCLVWIGSRAEPVELINTLQRRADVMTDEKGQDRRGKPNDRRRKRPAAPKT